MGLKSPSRVRAPFAFNAMMIEGAGSRVEQQIARLVVEEHITGLIREAATGQATELIFRAPATSFVVMQGVINVEFRVIKK